MLEDLKNSSSSERRLVILGTVTHNPDELGDSTASRLGLKGFAEGFKEPISMIDGKKFEPVKAYKDSKVCNDYAELHRRYHGRLGLPSALSILGVLQQLLYSKPLSLFQRLFPFSRSISRGGSCPRS